MNAVGEFDVAIVGLGPVGSALTALLAQAGLSVIGLEAETDIYPLPRAAHVDHEIMRIFQQIGIVDAIRPHIREAPDYEFRTANGELMMKIERAGVRGLSGWATSYNIYQPGIEAALRERLKDFPKVEARYGARFQSTTQLASGDVRIRYESAGVTASVIAKYVIGCDGAWSPVREEQGVALQDYAFDEPWLVLDTLVADEAGFPLANLQICDPDRPTSFVHMGPGRLRWEFMLRPDEDPETMKSDAALETLIGPWRRRGEIKIERRAVYRFHGLVANRWRSGNIFIAGDAAHQMPPFMGQGLCSGLRDAANLAWKIEFAIKHPGHGERLLDSYEAERSPHVCDIVERAIEMGRLVCTLDPAIAAERDRQWLSDPRISRPIPFPALTRGFILEGSAGAGELFPQPVDPVSGTAFDRIAGTDLLILHNSAWEPVGSEPIRSISTDDMIPFLADAISNILGQFGDEAILIRPDRYIFGTGSVVALQDASAAWLNGLHADERRPDISNA